MGFQRFSLSDEIRTEMREKDIVPTRTTLQEYADSVRRKEGIGVWARRITPKLPLGVDCVIDSIRNPEKSKYFVNRVTFFF